ncbi:MAG: ATP-binding protein, partial [Magnetococcales bacterium]|nr:ATP-binding protein [Nitrospirota bacterium]
MRSFYSYGPVNCRSHFCVPRRELIERCAGQLIGDIVDEGGRYFTIWAPRQTGKTWVMRQVR